MFTRATELPRLWLLALLAALAGCVALPPADEPPRNPSSSGKTPVTLTRGNPPFYEVLGQRYHVLPSAEGYKERGVASWYGAEFHGRSTSNGEIFDMYSVSAAHKSLPLPCYARVTNLRNGASIIVRINDRGPFVKNRLIDLSYAAALDLDMIAAGTTLVEVETIAPAPTGNGTAAATPAPGELFVQVGAFGEPGNAERLRDSLHGAGIDEVRVRNGTSSGRPVHRVRVGPIADVGHYDRVVEQLAALGIVDTHLTTE